MPMLQASLCTFASGVRLLASLNYLNCMIPLRWRQVLVCDLKCLLADPKSDRLQPQNAYFCAGDLVQSIKSAPKVIFDLLPAFLPYTLVLAAFGAFVVWNGGIVLGT